MKTNKLDRLKAGGWEVGNTEDFLQLSDDEAQLVELKLSLISAVKKSLIKRKLSQIDLAQRMKSSQSCIAKIEAGDPSVSLDLFVRALIASGATTREYRWHLRQVSVRRLKPCRVLDKHPELIDELTV